MQTVKHEFLIEEAYLPYIINGDASGLEEEEIRDVDAFVESVLLEAHESDEPIDFMHFAVLGDEREVNECCISRKLTTNARILVAVFAVI